MKKLNKGQIRLSLCCGALLVLSAALNNALASQDECNAPKCGKTYTSCRSDCAERGGATQYCKNECCPQCQQCCQLANDKPANK